MRAYFLCITLLLASAAFAEGELEKGVEAWNKGDRATAIALFEKAVELRPKSDLVQFNLAYAYSNTPGQGKLAAPIYEAILSRDPSNLAARWNLAILQLNAAGSIERCRELSNAEPGNKHTHYLVEVMAWALSSNDPRNNAAFIEEGLAAAKRALEIDPRFSEAMIYQNLLLRSKARAAETEEEKKALFEEANRVLMKGKTLSPSVSGKLPALSADALPPRLPIPPPPPPAR
jgi:tetratricopeptide (TPR) repeat protein